MKFKQNIGKMPKTDIIWQPTLTKPQKNEKTLNINKRKRYAIECLISPKQNQTKQKHKQNQRCVCDSARMIKNGACDRVQE